MSKKIIIGLYGLNGHQIHSQLIHHPYGTCLAVAGIGHNQIPESIRQQPTFTHYDDLASLLKDPRIHLVSLCSPRRCDQAQQAIQCMQHGKHVYAEKPCAMSETDLDAIVETAVKTGMSFHEMAGTAFAQPYYKMRQICQSGILGTIVQVLAQKSYPYHDQRPQDEDVDGGITLQAGVHALRFIEHVACVRVKNIAAIETELGNPQKGHLKMASSMMMSLENGGVASIICNYLNPHAFGSWGNETLRIFGTNGFLEAVDGGTKTRLVLQDKDHGSIEIDNEGKDYLDFFLGELLGKESVPFTLEEELHPTRILIRAKADADQRAKKV